MRTFGSFAYCLFPAILGLPALAQNTLYVNAECGDDAWTGMKAVCEAPDGPKRTMKAGVLAAGDGDTVLVAPGVYEGPGNDGVNFPGPRTLRAQAGPDVTIWEGAEASDRCAAINVPGVVIDGFTIRNFDTGVSPLIFTFEGESEIVNCRFFDNVGFYSGVIFWSDASGDGTIRVDNCLFARNVGVIAGVAYDQHVGSGVLEVANCTFLDNQGDLSASIYAVRANIFNSILRGQGPQVYVYTGLSVTGSSDVEGPLGDNMTDGGGNIDADPLFADPASDDFHLLPGSPCIDAADNTAVPAWITADIFGLPRFSDDPATEDTGIGPPPVVDMGAHEFLPACYADFTGDGALDLFDFLAFVNAFNAGEPDADCDGNGVLDLFDFLCFVNAFNTGC